nr:unnamed protein product [Digitaria exilis]
MAATAAPAALSMKLLIDRKAQRVLIAEASKDVVDFLFSLLALPVATAVKLVGKDAMVGSVGNLYSSVENLDSTYVQHGAAKDALLRPTVLSTATATTSLLRLPAAPSSGQPKSYFKCSNTYDNASLCSAYVGDVKGTSCPSCGSSMSTTLYYAAPSPGQQLQKAKGLVLGIVTYTVLDDLTGLAILKALLHSKTVLTDVFLGNKKAPVRAT